MISDELKNELTIAAILYRIQTEDVEILDPWFSTNEATPWIDHLCSEDLIMVRGDFWSVTNAGKHCFQTIIAAMNQIKRFDILSEVYLVGIPDEDCEVDDDGNLLPFVSHGKPDPRFNKELAKLIDPSCKSEDLRLAVISYALCVTEDHLDASFDEFSSARIIFLHKLMNADLDTSFWTSLFDETLIELCEDIASSHLWWNDLDEDDDKAWVIASILYEAAVREMNRVNSIHEEYRSVDPVDNAEGFSKMCCSLV